MHARRSGISGSRVGVGFFRDALLDTVLKGVEFPEQARDCCREFVRSGPRRRGRSAGAAQVRTLARAIGQFPELPHGFEKRRDARAATLASDCRLGVSDERLELPLGE